MTQPAEPAEPADESHEVPFGTASAELERLRALIGPDERSYEQLRVDVAGARDAARDAEAEAGRLRGRIAEMQVQLVRARQDQERYQRFLDARRSVHERLSAVKHRLLDR